MVNVVIQWRLAKLSLGLAFLVFLETGSHYVMSPKCWADRHALKYLIYQKILRELCAN